MLKKKLKLAIKKKGQFRVKKEYKVKKIKKIFVA
jgi:hypothetical protein